MATKGLNPKGTGPLFNVNNDTGMMTTRVYMTSEEAKSFLKKFYTSMINPSLQISMALNKDGSVKPDSFNLIMSTFSSIRIDFDLFDLTILDDNPNTRIMKETYSRNGFYNLSATPVIDKKNGELAILFEMYKNPSTDPMTFLTEVNKKNPEMLGYLYMQQLIGLSQKNYKNKFTLANRAKSYMIEHNPNMDIGLRNEAAVSLAKMAMDFHVNSLLLDNFNDRNSNSKQAENLKYLKNNPLILYNPEYNYNMTHLDILEKLLEDADFEFIDLSKQNNNGNGNGNGNNNSSLPSSNNNSDNGNNNNQNDNLFNTDIDDGDYGDSKDGDDMDSNGKNDGEDRNDGNNTPNNPPVPTNQQDGGKILKVSLKKNKYKVFFMNMPPQKSNDRYNRLDNADSKTIDYLQRHIDCGMQKLKGTGIANIFESLGSPIEIDMSWEDEIIRFVDNMTNMTASNKFENTWRKPNLYTRHIATLPGKKPIMQSTPTIYVIFDQSGSMDNNICRKINYVIKYFFDKKYNINVLIHDDSQTPDDVEVYEFRPESRSNYNDNMEIENLTTTRFKAGGTSHKGAFDLMEVYIREVTQRDKKYNTHYVLICSDLYSDIENIYQNYEWCRLLNNTTFALCPDKNMSLPFGKTKYVS